jgi:hypothetical protein
MPPLISLKGEHKQRDAADESHRAVTRSWAPKTMKDSSIQTILF